MWRELFRFFASLKLAVFSILLLAAVLAVATIIESNHGTRAAHVAVYGTAWFAGVLCLLGANVICAAFSRYPWKRHQIGFVLTHLGIIVLLVGSFLTQRLGVDGNLPVAEGQKNNEVMLTDPELMVQDETSGLEMNLRIPETVRSSSGDLLQVQLPDNAKLVLTRYVPRAQVERHFSKTDIPGVGVAAVHVEIYNDRFRLDEWITNAEPEKPTEFNLGPAVMTLERAWDSAADKSFFEPKKPKKQKQEKGVILVQHQGKEYRVRIEDALNHWQPLAGSDLELQVHRYLPFAVVEKNELVTRSQDPKNPAVQLVVRRKGDSDLEKHTVFAFFPEFPTLHGRDKREGQNLGLTLRMIAQHGDQENLRGVGSKRGRLRFGVSADGKKLRYQVLAASGETNAKGDVVSGQEMQTGWMDLKFKILEWYPYAVERLVPQPIEYISGAGDNYLSAIQLSVRGPREVASDDSFWLFEGTGKKVRVGGRDLEVSYTRQRLELPFFIELQKFTVGTDPGTSKAASYESQVFVRDPARADNSQSHRIWMNNPLVHGRYTFYQASYQIEEGKPPISVFAVNYDPGRFIKYLGSLIMVLGIAVMFYMNPHYWDIVLGRRRT